MPLPQRKPSESHDEFVERCMGDAVMVEEFPDAAQRRAVCERQGKVRTQSHLNLVCDPGAITIEAADAVAEGEKPRLPRFSMVAYTGGPMRIAGWRYPVIVDLAGLAIPSQSRPIRFGHDMASGVGHTDAIRIEDGRLVATGIVSRDTQAAREIVASARNGFPWQASIGAAVEEFEFVKENQKVLVNGRQFSGPVNVVRKAALGEISFVDLGADGATSASLAAAGVQPSQQENQAMESLSDTNPQVQPGEPADTRVAADGGDSGPAPQVPSPKPQASDAQAAEAARVLAVRMVCGGKHPQIESQAIQEHWDISRTALAVLREERPKVPALHVRSPEVVSSRLLEAACMLTAKAAKVEELFDEPTLEAATSEGRGVYSMLAPRLRLTHGRRCLYIPYGSTSGRYPHYRVNSRIVAVHGWSYARHATKNHLTMSQGRSVIHGHTHRADAAIVQNIWSPGRIVEARSAGCLCRLVPLYGTGRPVEWVHAFILGYLGRRSDTLYTVPILGRRCILPDGTEVQA